MDERTATRKTRPFRLGVVAPVRTDLLDWRDGVRRIADSGHSTLLMPDVPQGQLRAADSLAVLPDDPAAAVEKIRRRREEIGFSYFVFGAACADTLAPVLAELAGQTR